jgi:hypothetical protein
MTDIVTYCDVNTCEDCPRYGDDCDGDKRVEHTDTISRADAMAEFREWVKRANENGETPTWNDAVSLIGSLPSADAEPTVIRSKTLLPTKDFKEWAKRVRETNPNVIVIPCDAEVVSADAVQIHNDGTLEVKVPNAQKVGRVLVMDTDSRIGGGLFYPDDVVQGEWEKTKLKDDMWTCSACGSPLTTDDISEIHFCPNCGARMTQYKGGDDE